MKRRGFVAVLVIAIFFFGIPRLFLLPQINRALENDLKEALQAEKVEASLTAPWGWEVLFGRIPELEIMIEEGTIDGLDLSRVDLWGRDILFQPSSLWRDQEFVLTDTSNSRGEILISEAAINALFWREVDPERNLSIDVAPTGLGIQGSLGFWDMEWTITLRGDLEVRDGSILRFVLKNVEVQETRIPPILLELLGEDYDFGIDFRTFPYPVEITDIHFLENEIMVVVGGLR